jgi:hypothetical protein
MRLNRINLNTLLRRILNYARVHHPSEPYYGQTSPPRRAGPMPGNTNALHPAESVFLLAIRWWVADRARKEDPLPRLRKTLQVAGAGDAAFSVDHLMSTVARTARRPIEIRCPRRPCLSEDEQQLLQAASLAQADEQEQAARVLRTALLSAHGAEFALGPLMGLGCLFSQAKLMFRRRWWPVTDQQTAGQAPAWSPHTSTSIH